MTTATPTEGVGYFAPEAFENGNPLYRSTEGTRAMSAAMHAAHRRSLERAAALRARLSRKPERPTTRGGALVGYIDLPEDAADG